MINIDPGATKRLFNASDLILSIKLDQHPVMTTNFTLTRIAKGGLAWGIASFVAASAAFAQQDSPSREEMWRIIQQQQKQIDALTERLNASEKKVQATEQQVQATDEKVEATTAYVEQMKGGAGVPSGVSDGAWARQTRLGGYGELHYNMGNTDRIDFHRWVLFVSHDFSEKIRFFSEVELEHSFFSRTSGDGEIELEQAFLEFDLSESTKAQAGLFLVPVGMLNETHEPATFYGVERNHVENRIIPTTWWEAGASVSHAFANGFSFDVAAHSGLSVATSGSSAFNIRSGRKKVSNAPAKDGAVTTRVKYTGIPGLELALSAQYQQDLAQRTLPEKIDATLLAAHADWRFGGFGLRALYARWDLDGAAPAAIGADEQYGYYIEPSYRFTTAIGDVGFFGRYSLYDTTAGQGTYSKDKFYDLGVNYWPHPSVVLKADIQFTDFASSANDDIVNLGLGYQF